MIQSDRLAVEAIDFLEGCAELRYTPQRAALSDVTVRRVIAALYDGDVDRLARWYLSQHDERPEVMADILHAACHAVARGFERDDPSRLAEALWALEIIECEVAHPSESRNCCHEHQLGVATAFRKTA
ncbi:MAG: hypothetical protein ABR591_09870 [Candidatus Velthaea sp.]